MRGLLPKFITDLKGLKLKDFLIRVKEDDTLCLEIRENYINIYYRGGNLFRIEPWGNEYKVLFDLNYCSKHREIISQISPCDYEKWVEWIPQIKAEMDAYFHK